MSIIRLATGMMMCAIFLLGSFRTARAIDNLRVACPSLSSTAVFSLVVAQKEGYFKEEGLNVELLSIRGEIAIRTTLAGEVDFFTNAGSALAAAVRGVPVKLVTVFQDKPSWDLIAQPDIKSVAQLRGKNVGVMTRILPEKCDKALLLQSKGIVHCNVYCSAIRERFIALRGKTHVEL